MEAEGFGEHDYVARAPQELDRLREQRAGEVGIAGLERGVCAAVADFGGAQRLLAVEERLLGGGEEPLARFDVACADGDAALVGDGERGIGGVARRGVDLCGQAQVRHGGVVVVGGLGDEGEVGVRVAGEARIVGGGQLQGVPGGGLGLFEALETDEQHAAAVVERDRHQAVVAVRVLPGGEQCCRIEIGEGIIEAADELERLGPLDEDVGAHGHGPVPVAHFVFGAVAGEERFLGEAERFGGVAAFFGEGGEVPQDPCPGVEPVPVDVLDQGLAVGLPEHLGRLGNAAFADHPRRGVVQFAEPVPARPAGLLAAQTDQVVGDVAHAAPAFRRAYAGRPSVAMGRPRKSSCRPVTRSPRSLTPHPSLGKRRVGWTGPRAHCSARCTNPGLPSARPIMRSLRSLMRHRSLGRGAFGEGRVRRGEAFAREFDDRRSFAPPRRDRLRRRRSRMPGAWTRSTRSAAGSIRNPCGASASPVNMPVCSSRCRSIVAVPIAATSAVSRASGAPGTATVSIETPESRARASRSLRPRRRRGLGERTPSPRARCRSRPRGRPVGCPPAASAQSSRREPRRFGPQCDAVVLGEFGDPGRQSADLGTEHRVGFERRDLGQVDVGERPLDRLLVVEQMLDAGRSLGGLGAQEPQRQGGHSRPRAMTATTPRPNADAPALAPPRAPPSLLRPQPDPRPRGSRSTPRARRPPTASRRPGPGRGSRRPGAARRSSASQSSSAPRASTSAVCSGWGGRAPTRTPASVRSIAKSVMPGSRRVRGRAAAGRAGP